MAVWGGLTDSCEKKRSKKQSSLLFMVYYMFYHERVLNSIKCLFCLYWNNFWNVFVLLLNWHIMLIGFCMVNYPCSSGINPTWMVHNPFYMLLIQFCSILLKIFASIFYYLEKEMATHSSTLAWKIPWMEEPGRLQSMGSQSQTWLSDFTFFLSIVPFEEGNGTHSSVLAWRISWTEGPGGLRSMRLQRVGHG